MKTKILSSNIFDEQTKTGSNNTQTIEVFLSCEKYNKVPKYLKYIFTKLGI